MLLEYVNVFVFKNNYFFLAKSNFLVTRELLSPSCLTWKSYSAAHWAGNPSTALWWQEGVIACSLAVPLPGVVLVTSIEARGAFCSINCRTSVFALTGQSSAFPSQDCEKPGIPCLPMHCNLSALAREESRTIDIYMLLNTEILKKVSPEPLHRKVHWKASGWVSPETLPAPSTTFSARTHGKSAGGWQGKTRGSLFKVWARDPQQHLPWELASHAEPWAPPHTCWVSTFILTSFLVRTFFSRCHLCLNYWRPC